MGNELARTRGTVHQLTTRRAPRDASIVDRAELRAWVTEWRREVFEEAADDNGGGGLRVIVLRRAGERRPRALLTLPIDEDKDTETLVKRLADAAERYADNVTPGEHVAFEVCGFYGGEQVPRALEHIGLVGEEPEGSSSDLMSGGVKASDLVKAAVALAQSALMHANQKEARASRTITEALDLAYSRVDKLEKHAGELFEANMVLADHRAERDAVVMKAKAEVEFKAEAGKTAMALLPAVVNRMSIASGGPALLPEGVHPLLAQFSQITADLADEKLQGELFAVLSRHGAKGQRVLQGIGELMVSTASINAAAEAAAKGGEEAKATAAAMEAEKPIAAEPVEPPPPPFTRRPWI